MRCAALALLMPLAACSAIVPPAEVMPANASNWRAIITDTDRERLAGWREAFLSGLTEARAGHAGEIAAAGALLDPDAALPNAHIPAGLYRCRTIKLGAQPPRTLTYVSLPAATCQIRQDGNIELFARLSGPQRPIGAIFPDSELREVFLGTLVLSDETRAHAYGVDDQRDIVGYVERIGPERWRLVMPAPSFESKLDVMELTPAG